MRVAEEVGGALHRVIPLDDSDIDRWMQGMVKGGALHLFKGKVSPELEHALRHSIVTLGEYPGITKIKNETPIIVLSGPTWYAIVILERGRANPSHWSYSTVTVFSSNTNKFLLTVIATD